MTKANWETVRVFISSTFRDMQAERDYLVRFVFPRLREDLLKRRIHFVEVDLRWGVTSDQDALGVCREVIDECRPRFFCLLGERYGWVPPGQEDSITADEIQYAVLDRAGKHGYAFFYFRDSAVMDGMDESTIGEYREPVGSKSEQKILALKKAIINAGFSPRNYKAEWDKRRGCMTGLESFGIQVYIDLMRSIEDEFGSKTPAPVEEFDRERAIMEAFIAERVDGYVTGSRESILQELSSFIHTSGEPNILFFTGASGTGKSALLANFIHSLSQVQDSSVDPPLVIYHFIAVSPGSTSLRHTLRRLCHELFAALGMHDELPIDLYQLIDRFHTLLVQAASRRRLVLIIDGLNQFDSEDDPRTMHWLPWELPPDAHIIFSTATKTDRDATVDAGPELQAIRARGTQVKEISLAPLVREDSLAITKAFLTRYQKRMTSDQQETLLDKPESGNPLYLSITLEELRTYGIYEKVKERILELPDNVHSLFQWILSVRLSNDPAFLDNSGRAAGMQLVRQVVSLLCVSRNGLTYSALIALVDPGDPKGNVAALLRLLRPYLMRRGELIDFYHDQFRKAVKRIFLESESDRVTAHRSLATYFLNQADSIGDGSWNKAAHRALTEAPYHLFEAQLYDRLFSVAKDGRFLNAQVQANPGDPRLSLETIQYAIRAAVAVNDAGLMAKFSLHHAQRITALREESPLNALTEGELSHAWNMADCADPERSALWYLLLMWELKANGRLDEARETLKKLADKQTVPFTEGWMEEIAAQSLAECTDLVGQHFYDVTAKLIKTKCSRLCRQLCEKGFGAIALQVADIIDPSFRDEALVVIGLDFAEKGDFARGLGITGKIKHIRRCNKARCDIATSQATASDNHGAMQTLAMIEREVDNYDSPEIRTEVLQAIARTKAEIGFLHEARQTFDKALTAALDIDDYMDKHDKAIKSIAIDEANSGDFDRAFDTTWNIHRPEIRVDSHCEIAQIQARAGELEGALKVANKMPYKSVRSYAFAAIATEQARTGDISGAFASLNKVTRYESRDDAYKAIAAAQALAGKVAKAIRTAEKINQSNVRIEAFSAIVAARVEAGDVTEALSIAEGIEGAGESANAFCAIADAQAQAGDYHHAQKTFVQAVSMAKGIDSGWQRDRTLGAIAVPQAQAQEIPGAIATAKEIQDENRCAKALVDVALVQVSQGDFDGARHTLAGILKAANSIHPTSLAQALCIVAANQLNNEDNQGAQLTLDKALIAAKQVTNTWLRDKIYAEIAFSQARAEDYARGLAVSERIEGARYRVKAICDIAVAQARAKNKDDAHQTLIQALAIWKNLDVLDLNYSAILIDIASTVVQTEYLLPDLLATLELPHKIINVSDPYSEMHFEGVTERAEIYSRGSDLLDKRDEVLSAMAKAQARAGKIKKGLLAADIIFNKSQRLKTTIAIALIEAEDANQDDQKAFSHALSIVEKTPHGRSDASGLKDFAVAIARSKNIGQGLLAANKIDMGKTRAFALCAIAIMQIADEGYEAAQQTFVKAKTAVGSYNDEDLATITGDFVSALAKSCDPAKAMQIVERIAESTEHDKVLYSIAKTYAQMGNLSKAEKTANRILEAPWDNRALRAITTAYIQAGDFARALRNAEDIEDKWEQRKIFCEIAAALANNSELTQAMHIAQEFPDEYDRADILCAIAMAQAQAGDLDQAMETLNKFGYAYQRNKVLETIATSHAQDGNISQAISIIGLIERATERLDALNDIVLVLAKENKYTAAIQVLPHCLGSEKLEIAAIVNAFDISEEKDRLAGLLSLCAEDLKTAYQMCGVLVKQYPHQATAIAKAIE